MHAHEDFVIAGPRRVDVPERQIIGGSVPLLDNRFHRSSESPRRLRGDYSRFTVSSAKNVLFPSFPSASIRKVQTRFVGSHENRLWNGPSG
jgi:hypothetical protein